MEFGKLEYLDLRTVWANEALNFTPWLADNIQALGDLLGLELELKEREASVGNFSCDLHALDLGSGRSVIIENQLEATDHSHLGQVLTYAAGLEASVVVWVAKEIRDEHRAALDWLNRKTDSDTNFFAVIPRVFKIDDSKPSYELQLIVSPNEWSKSSLPPTEPPSEKSLQYKQFFQGVIDTVRQRGFKGLKRALPQSWIRFSTGIGDVGFYIGFVASTQTLNVDLFLESSTKEVNKARFDLLKAQQEEVETKVGMPLIWERLDDKKGCRIALSHAGTISLPPEDLDALSIWATNTLALMRERLLPYVQLVVAQQRDNMSA